MKKLSEMTLEELWQLFPIFLCEHKAYWKDDYAEEEKRLINLLQIKDAVFSHIGSTAIKNIWAKPIIDILLELPESTPMEPVKKALINAGYICMCENFPRIDFNRGYTENGFADKVFHLHLRYAGDNDELYFRNYLNDFPDLAKQYEQLKLSLWKKYEHDRDAYTNAKGDFIKKQTSNAKKLYGK